MSGSCFEWICFERKQDILHFEVQHSCTSFQVANCHEFRERATVAWPQFSPGVTDSVLVLSARCPVFTSLTQTRTKNEPRASAKFPFPVRQNLANKISWHHARNLNPHIAVDPDHKRKILPPKFVTSDRNSLIPSRRNFQTREN